MKQYEKRAWLTIFFSSRLKPMKRGYPKDATHSVLANPTRLAILEMLGKAPRSVTEIANTLKQEQSMISHDLGSLEQCRFVIPQKKKKERIYSLNRETVEPLFKLFDFHAQKYCPTQGKCLTEKGLRQMRKKEASSRLHVTH